MVCITPVRVLGRKQLFKMKKYLFALLAISLPFLVGSVKAQIIEFEKVVESNMTKNKLYSNAQKWGSTNSPLCKRKIDISNKEDGSLTITIELRNKERETSETKYLTYKFRFNVNIDCKDKKYRYTISSPSVLVGVDNSINIRNLSTKQLLEYENELKSVARISENEFNKILEWELEKIATIIDLNNSNINQYNEQISNLEGNKKNKKEIQRIKYRLEDITANNLILNESLQRWYLVVNSLSADIEKAMNISDDF